VPGRFVGVRRRERLAQPSFLVVVAVATRAIEMSKKFLEGPVLVPVEVKVGPVTVRRSLSCQPKLLSLVSVGYMSVGYVSRVNGFGAVREGIGWLTKTGEREDVRRSALLG